MNANQKIQETEEEIRKTIEKFKEEIRKIHTGRANPSLVEDILVDYYGGKSPLKQVASINIPEPRVITISPWNKDDLVSIEKALREAELNINPQNDGEVIRLNLPPLTAERRLEMTKMVNKEKENTRIQVKQKREDAWDEIKTLEQNKTISEDEKFRFKDKLQELIDKINADIDKIAEQKEKEITTI